MITGSVSEDGVPLIAISVADREWRATIDTGFNGDLELPEPLRPFVNPRFVGRIRFLLGAGQTAVEDTFLVNFTLDEETVLAEAAFTLADEILVGTGMLRQHQLEIHFPNHTVFLRRVA